MAISKVTLNGTTLMDVTGNTNTANTILDSYIGTGADGETITGQYSAPNLESSKSYTVSASGSQTISPSSTYDAMEEVALTVPAGTATSASSISGTGATISTGTNTIKLSKTISNTPRITTAGYITAGTAGNSAIELSATVSLKGATTYTPTTTDQTIASNTYITGTQTISGDANLVASNIKKDVSIFNVTGAYEGTGGSSWHLVASKDITVSTTSTSASQADTIAVPYTTSTDESIIYVKVRDKAGKRAGYFLGSDTFIFNTNKANNSTSEQSTIARIIHRYSSSSQYGVYTSGSTTGYGVYAYSIQNSSGTADRNVLIYRRYSSSYSLTINGTYNVQVYLLDYAPSQGNPFNYSYSS